MIGTTKEGYDNTLQNAVALEQFKAAEIKKIGPFLREIERYIRVRLSYSNLTEYRRDRLEKLLKAIREFTAGAFLKWEKELNTDLRSLAKLQSRWEADNMNLYSTGKFEATLPAANTLYAALTTTPMSVRGLSGSPLLKVFIKNYTASQVAAIDGMIRQGVAEGLTNNEIVRNLRGTKAAKYRDGLLGGRSLRQAQAVVRTAINHVSSVARMQTALANKKEFPKYQWISVLDSRTSEICMSLSLQIFDTGEGPLPPAHVNCRSTIVYLANDRIPELDAGMLQATTFGPVPANQTYYDWLSSQNKAFQDYAIGPTYAKLLRNGGLGSDEFARLRLDKNFRPRTLAEMEERKPAAFRKAGITLNPETGLPL